MIEIGLLAIIAAAEVTRLVLTFKPSTVKQHFKQKLEATQKMIWDLTFKKFKTQEIREEIRVKYDENKGRLFNLKKELENWQGDEKGKKEREDQVVLLERDVQNKEQQLAQLDIEVNGAKPSEAFPQGYPGIVDQIEDLRSLTGMLKDHIKTL